MFINTDIENLANICTQIPSSYLSLKKRNNIDARKGQEARLSALAISSRLNSVAISSVEYKPKKLSKAPLTLLFYLIVKPSLIKILVNIKNLCKKPGA